MLRSEDVTGLLLVAHVAVLVGVLEEAELVLSLQHPTASAVDVLHLEEPFADGRLAVMQEGLGAHVHIGACLQGLYAVLLLRPEAPARHLGDAGVVGHHEALEAPLAAEHLVEEPGIGRGMLSVHDVEAGHHASHACPHGSLVGRHVLVEHAPAAHVHRIVVATGLGSAVEGVVLQAGHDVVLLLEVALIAAHKSCCDEAAQVGVLAAALHDAAPARVERNVHHRAVGPRDAVRRALLGSDACTALNGGNVPRAGLSQRDGQDGAVAVYHVEPHQQGDAQTAPLHGHLLYGAYLVLARLVEDGAQVAVHHQRAHLGVHRTAGGDVARRLQVQLPNLLAKRHLLHQRADEAVHLLVRRRPQAKRAAQQGQQ